MLSLLPRCRHAMPRVCCVASLGRQQNRALAAVRVAATGATGPRDKGIVAKGQRWLVGDRGLRTGRLEYAPRLFRSLGLMSFDEKEIRAAFERYDRDKDGLLQDGDISGLLREVLGPKCTTSELQDAVAKFRLRFHQGEGAVTFDEFRTNLVEMGKEVDARVYPIAASMLLLGTSVGMIAPLMPVFVEAIKLTPGEFGHVVGAFALSKLVGNIPAAVLVERYGRKPLLMYPLILMTAGMVGVGAASTVEHLVAARLLAGFGVAMFSTAATLSMADISTSLNRASTMSPMMAGFSAGTVLGPALGGYLGDTLGIRNCFYLVGACYASLIPLNYTLLSETRPPLASPDTNAKVQTMREGFAAALSSWRPLLGNGRIRSILAVNFVYWCSISGSSMTILPMLLTSKFEFTASQIGTVFAAMSAVNVLGSAPLSRLADHVGKRVGIVAGSTMIGLGMACVPLCTSVENLALSLGLWALGTTTLGTTPTAHMTDLTKPQARAQALALLRTCGDMGMLVGASAGGMLADFSSFEETMLVGSGLLLTSTAWFAIRSRQAT